MADLAAIGDKNLWKLPGPLFLKIRNHLDVNEQNSGWRSFIAILGGDYTLSSLAEFEREESPTTKLLSVLGSQGMTINDFVNCAVLAEDYFILSLFNVYMPVQIMQQPWGEKHVLEGESVSLTVKAKGFPLPQYQWFKDDIQLDEATNGTYYLQAQSSQDDSGDYCCLVYNSDDPALLRFTKPVTVKVLPAPEPEITEHPRSCTINLGGNALFKCEVWGEDGMHYQWFLDEKELHDVPNVIQGSNTNELRLYNIVSEYWLGCYSCQVSRGTKTVITNGAVLQISDWMPSLKTKTNYTATDKVALLIGNYDYRSDNVLSAPKHDVQTLSTIFQSLNFKVVSLLNLTKSEMIAAVQEFRKLVGKGVYCVFYFCGHGFEIANQSFLVPTDAPMGYNYMPCVSADSIFRSLLRQEPQICCMILDICRKSRDEQAKPALLDQDVVERGNAIVCYGTSYGLSAYEKTNYGILVSHLKNILSLPVDIETVFKKLRTEIANDPKVNCESGMNQYKQIPEIRTNLLEVNRSFTDPIVYKGHTTAYKNRQLLWENAHRKPEPIILDFEFPGFSVIVRLDFQQEFSNVLKIYTSVMNPGPTQTCTAFVSAIPADVAEKARVVTIYHSKDRQLSKNYVVINNIQRLKSAVTINITVKCTGPEVEKTEPVDLGLPLVAQLQLWKERHDLNSQRKAEEVDEGQEVKDVAEDFQDLNCQ